MIYIVGNTGCYTIRIESLGHGKRLGLWVEFVLKTCSCNPLISLL